MWQQSGSCLKTFFFFWPVIEIDSVRWQVSTTFLVVLRKKGSKCTPWFHGNKGGKLLDMNQTGSMWWLWLVEEQVWVGDTCSWCWQYSDSDCTHVWARSRTEIQLWHCCPQSWPARVNGCWNGRRSTVTIDFLTLLQWPGQKWTWFCYRQRLLRAVDFARLEDGILSSICMHAVVHYLFQEVTCFHLPVDHLTLIYLCSFSSRLLG